MSRTRQTVGRRGAVALGLLALPLLAACPDRNRGVSPDGAGLFFPAGTVLDPRVAVDEPARWMFVLNANSDLVFNAGTVVPVDMKNFFDKWMRDPDACFGVKDTDGDGAPGPEDPAACKPGNPPGVKYEGWPQIGDVGAELTAKLPCRRNALKPQVIECEDTYFLDEDSEVLVGNFGTALRGWTAKVPAPQDPEAKGKLLVGVRGDPSVTLIDLTGPVDDPRVAPTLKCGQGEASGMYDPRRCAGDHLLQYLRNDEDSSRIDAEPVNILATPGDPQVLVTHSTRSQVTVIDLEGQYQTRDTGLGCRGVGDDKVCKDGKPAIVHAPTVFELDGAASGGWGLARRPCFPGTDNVPALTVTRGQDGEPQECGRSLIYAGFRTDLFIARSFLHEAVPLDSEYLGVLLSDLAERIAQVMEALDAATDPAEEAELQAELASLQREQKRYEGLSTLPASSFDQRCLTAGEVADDQLLDDDLEYPFTKGAMLCDTRLFTAGAFRAAAFDIGVGGQANVLGDIAFSADGNRLFAVQTTPGALVYVDTSLDDRSLTRDLNAGLVELCAQPTAMALFADGANEYAAVTCYKPQEMFIVDLSGVRVVANIVLGTGPHAMTVDHARQYLYVANSLDKTISVVDISRLRATRFSEIARLGKQVPYLR